MFYMEKDDATFDLTIKQNVMNYIKHRSPGQLRAKILTGVLVITFGVLFLLKTMGVAIPFKILSWKIILICIGLVMLVKHDFKKLSGYILIAIGGVFLLNDLSNIHIDTKFLWPVLIIVFGISIIYKNLTWNSKKKEWGDTVMFDDETEISDDEYFESNALFGGVNKNVVSKNFRGAKIGSYFGGTELNFTKADINGTAEIDLNTIFGGTTIIVPSGWEVRSEMTTIFGGVEDKRPVLDVNSEGGKLLILKGNCIFGGVDIQSYV